MSIGSVPPNPGVNCIRNVTFRNITFENPLKAIYIKPNPAEAGTGLISDITYENIEIHNAIWWAIFIGTQQQHQVISNLFLLFSFGISLNDNICYFYGTKYISTYL